MARVKKTIVDEMSELIELFTVKDLQSMFDEYTELFELFNVTPDDDWVKDAVGEENFRQVRMIRMCYIISRLAQNHCSLLCSIKLRFPFFYQKLEKHAEMHSGNGENNG